MGKIIGKDLIVDIKKVEANDWNPKEKLEDNPENKERYEEILQEVDDKGLFEAITVRELGKDRYQILDGYHRWRACNELEFDTIRINNLGEIKDDLAKAITLIKEQKKVPISELLVADLVGEMSKGTGDLVELARLLGYSEETLEDYIKMYEFDWNQYEKKDEDAEKEDPKLIKCPECGHQFKE